MDGQLSPRFCGIKTFMRLPHIKTTEDVDFVIVGSPFDTGGTFAVGTRFGPEAVRSMSTLLKPYHPGLEIDIFKYCSGVDYGDFDVNPGYIDESYQLIEEQLDELVSKKVIPIIIGGDHSVSLPHLRSIAKQYGPVSLVHFDSHGDTWDSYFGKKYTHGTVFRRAVEEGIVNPNESIQIGMRGTHYCAEDALEAKALGYQVITTDQVKALSPNELGEKIRQRVKNNPVFVSFDIDFLDAAFAPGTGTPEIGGFNTYEAQQFVRQLTGLNIIGFDLVEVLPDRDPTKITSIAAANICYEFIGLIAWNKRKKQNALFETNQMTKA
ncbi:agmatinase [Bacillus sp. FJAT-29790]|nr:agmatinase [Bacillus sp. FJAT-29790]